jgi:hypothetical protein
MSIDHLPGPHRVRKKDRIDRRAGAIVIAWPQVGIGVERLGRRSMTESRLHNLDALAVPDQQAGVTTSWPARTNLGTRKLVTCPLPQIPPMRMVRDPS